MKNYSVFDVLGPVMIGPSSSHTAGAARLGKIAKSIVWRKFNKVEFYLHGSFAETYKGHGTDRALVAGVLGMDAHDERLRDALRIAKEEGLEVEFIKTELEDEHPNTVKMVFHLVDKNINGGISEVTGSSIGGGNIIITNVDGQEIEFSGTHPTIIVRQRDGLGLVAKMSAVMAENDICIATMKMARNDGEALVMIETDSEITQKVIDQVYALPDVTYVKPININN